MLDSLLIANEASYDAIGRKLAPCTSVNFIYGSNGSGKTTISRVLSDPAKYADCALKWRNNQPIQTLVYNIDFVKSNFSSSIPGIFTLGKASADVEKRIAQIDVEKLKIQDKAIGLKKVLGGEGFDQGKKNDLAAARKRFEEDCWKIKTKHDTAFKEVFQGFMGGKASFADKILTESSDDLVAVDPISTLVERTQTVFQKGASQHPQIVFSGDAELAEAEEASIFKKLIVGKDNVDLAGLIQRLGMSDWVKQGRKYLESSDNTCPFCQQALISDLKSKMDDYFDETFLQNSQAVRTAQSTYNTQVDQILQKLVAIRNSNSGFLDVDSFVLHQEKLSHVTDNNRTLINSKMQNLSVPITLSSTANIMDQLLDLIAKADVKIKNHNELVANLQFSKNEVRFKVWQALTQSERTMIKTYKDLKRNLANAIESLEQQIIARRKEYGSLEAERRDLERKLTGVQSTVDEMNSILNSFGFKNFRMETAGERGEQYRIARLNGNDAALTLSEGEKSFVSFLYFYHLLKGSTQQSGVAEDRVVVIDDPISSLDSEILFIVSSLVKRVILDVCDKKSHLKQIFILTHNVYFHKEVSYDSRRSEKCLSHESFWIVRKYETGSEIINFPHNPVKTAYELLWHEVKDPHNASITIQNTLRRLIENYFRVFGNVSNEKILSLFEGPDKIICQTLISWVNDGSHSVYDDVYVSLDDASVDRYKEVFRLIFERTDHLGHYNMMMGISA